MLVAVDIRGTQTSRHSDFVALTLRSPAPGSGACCNQHVNIRVNIRVDIRVNIRVNFENGGKENSEKEKF